ncbi:MAG: tetratricopeptide repeat protein [Afipia sp.]|nr:tetratricopeptide repeat protein [Afipia sp.]
MKSSFESRYRCFLTIAVLAITLCFAFPSSAQRSALDLAQAGFLAKDRREYGAAIRLFDDALKHGLLDDKQRGFLMYSRGASFEALGFRDRALADFDAAVALIPDFPKVHLYRGVVFGDKGQYQQALQDFLTASKLDPTDPLVFNNLGTFMNVWEISIARSKISAARSTFELAMPKHTTIAPTLSH